MSWASKRRATYLFSLLGVVLVVIGVSTFALFRPTPSCGNGKKDGTETGIDCGGSCRAVCAQNVIAPIMRWSRSFEVTPGTYSAVAYVENPNSSTGAEAVSYEFRLLDAEGILVAERKGSTFISPGALMPVFEAGIRTGERVPVYTTFSFTEEPFWVRSASRSGELLVREKLLSDDATAPRITARLQNTTIKTLSNVQVVAVVFDASGNALAASSTVVPRIERSGTADIVFTWPAPFRAAPAQIDIIPRFAL